MNGLMNLKIPVGTTATGGVFEIETSVQMTNCYITGCVGSGKSNLLRAIVKNTMKKYASKNINIWLLNGKTNEFNDFLSLYPNKLTNFDISSEKSAKTTIKKLFEETKKRFKLLKENSEGTYAALKDDTIMSRLLIIIDDFHAIDRVITEDLELRTMFEEVLVTGRALGISLIMTNQVPKCECRGLSQKAQAYIQILLSLNNSDGFIFNALDVTKQGFSESEKEIIYNHLIDIGTFAFNECSFNEKNNQYTNKITLAIAEYIPYNRF